METLQTTVAAIPDVLTWSVLVYTLGGLTLGITWGAVPALSTNGDGAADRLLRRHAARRRDRLPARSLFRQRVRRLDLGRLHQHPRQAELGLHGDRGLSAVPARRGRHGRSVPPSSPRRSATSFGTVVLVICTPFVLALALGIGAWEIFLLGLWGVLFSGSISDAPPLKGWLAGLIGLSIAFVGAGL